MYTLINNNPKNFKISTDELYVVLNPIQSYALVGGSKSVTMNKYGNVSYDMQSPAECLAAAILGAFHDNDNTMTVELMDLVLIPEKTIAKKKSKK